MFFQNVKILAEQVGILYIMVLVGVFCDKIGWFTQQTGKKCTDLLFYIITPFVIVKSFMTQEFTPESGKKLLVALGCGFLLHFIAIGINTPIFSKGDKKEGCVYKYGSMYGNVGYMALPLTQAILGSEGVFYCSAVVMAFNVVSFTHGTTMMDDKIEKFDFKCLVLNPGVISVAIGLPFYLLDFNIPDIISTPVNMVASTQTPLAMIIFGTFIANTKISDIAKHKKIFLAAFTKLIVLPLVMFAVFKVIGISGNLLVALLITCCAPSANNTIMFAAKYDKDTGLASQLVAIISFISIITIPVIIAAVQTYS